MPRSATITIQLMTVAELSDTVAMIIEQHKTDDLKPYPPPNEVALAEHLLKLSLHGKVFVAISEKRVVGILSLESFYFAWNPSIKYMRNVIFIVIPEYRKSSVTDALITKAREFSEEHGESLIIGVAADQKAEIKDRMLKMKGGQYLGGNFLFHNQEV